MKNYIQPGCTLELVAPYDVASGAGAKVGSIFGVATDSVLSGASQSFAVEGVFDLAKTTSQAWSQGAPLYWDNSGKLVTTVSTSNLFIGHAVVAALSADTVGRVRLHGASI